MLCNHHYSREVACPTTGHHLLYLKWVEREKCVLHSVIPLTKNSNLLTLKEMFIYLKCIWHRLVVHEYAILQMSNTVVMISAILFTNASYCFMWKWALLSVAVQCCYCECSLSIISCESKTAVFCDITKVLFIVLLLQPHLNLNKC